MTDTRLEPFSEQHLDGLTRLTTDPLVLRFTTFPEPVPEGFAQQWLGRYTAARLDGTREAFAIVADGEFAGIAVVPVIDRRSRTAELGYAVAPHARGKGVATAALRLLTDWAFEELDPVRLELFITAANAASQAVARRCGYTFEGVLRSAYVKPGRWEDTGVWSRLASD